MILPLTQAPQPQELTGIALALLPNIQSAFEAIRFFLCNIPKTWPSLHMSISFTLEPHRLSPSQLPWLPVGQLVILCTSCSLRPHEDPFHHAPSLSTDQYIPCWIQPQCPIPGMTFPFVSQIFCFLQDPTWNSFSDDTNLILFHGEF